MVTFQVWLWSSTPHSKCGRSQSSNWWLHNQWAEWIITRQEMRGQKLKSDLSQAWHRTHNSNDRKWEALRVQACEHFKIKAPLTEMKAITQILSLIYAEPEQVVMWCKIQACLIRTWYSRFWTCLGFIRTGHNKHGSSSDAGGYGAITTPFKHFVAQQNQYHLQSTATGFNTFVRQFQRPS